MQALADRLIAQPSLALPDGLADFLRLVAEPNRLRILVLLARGERCVCDIEAVLDLPQNLVSHHLAALRRAGAVHDRREGKWVYYALNSEALRGQLNALVRMLDVTRAASPAPPCAEDRA